MLLPQPTSTFADDASGIEFQLTSATAIAAPDALARVSAWLQSSLRPSTGLPIREHSEGSIILSVDKTLPEEGYRLVTDHQAVRVTGGSEAGVFYGCQTLLQLLPPQIFRRSRVDGVIWVVPTLAIEDAPRFGWRGTMLDVARHFMPKHDVFRFVDLMAMHKLNILHLHLTDDQGWRIEIKKYPLLTEVGGWRHETQVGAGEDAPTDGRPHGGFYTQNDIREIVAYAAARFITVVPEIETPGHVHAAIAAYPHLGVGPDPLEVSTRWGIDRNVLNAEESTVRFFLDVFDEVMDLFPGLYVGVGGDECPRDQWRADPRVQERLIELGLADEDAIQDWFIGRMDERITSRGRRIFGWDEILEGDPAPGATVASWRGMTGAIAAARRGYDVVACPDDQVYLDYRQSDGPEEPIPVAIPLTVEDVYAFQPVPDELSGDEAKRVLGGQANIWTEYMDSPRAVDFFAFPRLCAIAEVLWSGPDGQFSEFEERLGVHLARLDAIGVEYRRSTGPQPWQRRPGIPGRPATRAEREVHIADIVANIMA